LWSFLFFYVRYDENPLEASASFVLRFDHLKHRYISAQNRVQNPYTAVKQKASSKEGAFLFYKEYKRDSFSPSLF